MKRRNYILFGLLILLALGAISQGGKTSESDTSSSKDMNTGTNTSNDNDAGLEESRRVYRKGYSDGQTGYGLPASQRGSADDFIMAYGYNFSSADYYVYKMGFQDGLYGRPKQY